MSLKETKIDFINFEPSFASKFRELNLAWIQKYFVVEPEDLRLLNDPQNLIIEPGGFIVFAKNENEIVGTCALIKQDAHAFELAKMCVAENMQGKHIGYKMGKEMIHIAKKHHAKRIVLETNSSLKPALALYEKLGFQYIPITQQQKDRYQRADIMMELIL